MTSIESTKSLQEKTGSLIKGAWVTLGVPFDFPSIDEKAEGIIDVEALIIATLLLDQDGRMETDLPAWLTRFSSLINHQKLKSMLKTISQEKREHIIDSLSQGLFHGAPKPIRHIFQLAEPASEAALEAIQKRAGRLNTVENVARASRMIYSRLLYGTGFRADLVTLTHIEGFGMKGTQLAKLLCTNDSTVSRILNDLRACRFIDHDNERTGLVDAYPGMFLSAVSVWNLCEIIDAFEFSFEELRQGAFGGLDLKHDGFGRKLLAG